VESHRPVIDGTRYAKLTSGNNKNYWVIAHPLGEKPSLQLVDFFSGNAVSRVALDADNAPVFMPQGHQAGIVVTANGMGEWVAIQLDKQSKSHKKYTKLKSMLSVTETTIADSKFIVSGVSKDNMPILIMLDGNLEIQHELTLNSKIKGQVSSVFSRGEKLYAAVSFFDISSELWELSRDLTIVKKIKLAGGAATGILLKSGDIAVTYSVGKDIFDVFVEKLDSNLNSIWVRKISTRTGVQTSRYLLCELPGGLGLVGGNNGRLMVARIDASGDIFHITEDVHSGLQSPATEVYSVGVLGNKIHVRGMAANSDGSSTSFHFVETAKP
jgi:hypothetical protein